MSELPAEMIQAPAPGAGTVTFEQRLFELSPFGTLPTATGIFLLLVASFEGLAVLSRYPLARQLTFSPSQVAWPAAILSLMAAVALGMQRYARLKDIEDAPVLSHLIPCGASAVTTIEATSRTKLRWATIGGAIVGASAAFVALPASALRGSPLIFLWFALVMGVVGALFARGSVMTKLGARNFAQLIDRDLRIDLLRIDELSVIGRGSARTALIWFSVAAVICLFFASGDAPILVIGTVAVSAGMGLWIFFKPLEHIHRRIRDAKRAELVILRKAIAEARVQAVHDHEAAARLHGLLAYETRVSAVHEWPFDQLTLLRVGAYVLIPAIPWFGEAFVNYFVERIAH